MKTLTLSILFFFAACIPSIAQDKMSLTWNEKYSEAFTNFIISEDSEHIYTLSNSESTFFIEQYGKEKLDLKKQSPFELPTATEAELEFLVGDKDGATIFYSEWSKKDNITSMFVIKVDLSGKITKAPVEILKITNPLKYPKGNFKIVKATEASTEYLIYHYYSDYYFQSQVITLAIVDNQLNIISKAKKDFREEKWAATHHFLKCYMDNAQKIYILSRNEYDSKNTLYSSHLHQYSIENETLKDESEYEIKKEGESIEYPIVFISPDDKVILAGIRKGKKLAEDKKTEAYYSIGTSWVEIDAKTNKIKVESHTNFEEKQLKTVLATNLSVYLEATEILPNDKGYYLVCEVRVGSYTEQRHFTLSGQRTATTSSWFYGYQNILVCNLDNEGNVNWLGTVIKDQGFVAVLPLDWDYNKYKAQSLIIKGKGLGFGVQKNIRPYLSYNLFYENNKLYFLFNDSPNNFKDSKEDNFVQFGFSYGTPAYAVLSGEGKSTKHLFYPKPLPTIRMRSGLFYKTTEGDYIIFSDKGKVNCLGKVTLE